MSFSLQNMSLGLLGRGPEARWKKIVNQIDTEKAVPLAAYYAVGLPDKRVPVHQASILALDFETTGLDPKKDEILSMGWVVIEGGFVDMATAHHAVVCPRKSLNHETIPIHGIGHDDIEVAPPLEDVLPILLQALSGRFLLAHHTKIELGFLDASCRQLYGAPFENVYLDTLLLERRKCQRQGQEVGHGGFRLDEARKRYHLPRYKAHNALTDALAAAELFLAQVSYAGGYEKVRVSDLII